MLRLSSATRLRMRDHAGFDDSGVGVLGVVRFDPVGASQFIPACCPQFARKVKVRVAIQPANGGAVDRGKVILRAGQVNHALIMTIPLLAQQAYGVIRIAGA